MRIFLVAFLLVSSFAFAKDHEWQDGKLVQADVRQEEVAGGMVGTSSLSVPSTYAYFLVEVGEVVYTVRGERVGHNAGDIAKGLVVGDDVRVSIEGKKLYLLLPSGKGLSTDILTRERLPGPR